MRGADPAKTRNTSAAASRLLEVELELDAQHVVASLVLPARGCDQSARGGVRGDGALGHRGHVAGSDGARGVGLGEGSAQIGGLVLNGDAAEGQLDGLRGASLDGLGQVVAGGVRVRVSGLGVGRRDGHLQVLRGVRRVTAVLPASRQGGVGIGRLRADDGRQEQHSNEESLHDNERARGGKANGRRQLNWVGAGAARKWRATCCDNSVAMIR